MNANKQTVWDRMSPKQQAIARARDYMDASARAKKNLARRQRQQVYAELGLVRVRGALGGTYYE